MRIDRFSCLHKLLSQCDCITCHFVDLTCLTLHLQCIQDEDGIVVVGTMTTCVVVGTMADCVVVGTRTICVVVGMMTDCRREDVVVGTMTDCVVVGTRTICVVVG